MVFRPPDLQKRVPFEDPGAPGGVILIICVLVGIALGGYFILGLIEAAVIMLVGGVILLVFWWPWKLRHLDRRDQE